MHCFPHIQFRNQTLLWLTQNAYLSEELKGFCIIKIQFLFSFRGAMPLLPPDQGLCPWTLLGALPPTIQKKSLLLEQTHCNEHCIYTVNISLHLRKRMSHHLKTFADTHHKICENCSKNTSTFPLLCKLLTFQLLLVKLTQTMQCSHTYMLMWVCSTENVTRKQLFCCTLHNCT